MSQLCEGNLSPTKTLATYAANLSYGEIPTAVTERMIDCVLDSLGAAIYGVSLPWSQALIGYARRYGSGGKSSIFGVGEKKVQAPFAALATGGVSQFLQVVHVAPPPGG